MNFYEKPSFTVEALITERDIAADQSLLGEVDPLKEEISIPAGNWGDLVAGGN